MACYKPTPGCGVYEMYSCSECPYSKPVKENKKEKSSMNSSDLLLSLDKPLNVWKVGDTICVAYDKADVKDGICLVGAFGKGGTFEGACHDYLSQIRGKTLVFNAFDGKARREVVVLG